MGCGTGRGGIRPSTGASEPWASSGSAAQSRGEERAATPGHHKHRGAASLHPPIPEQHPCTGKGTQDRQVQDVGSSWIGQQQIFLNFFPFPDPRQHGEIILLFCRLKQRFQNPRLLFLSASLTPNPRIFHVKRAGIPLKDSLKK